MKKKVKKYWVVKESVWSCDKKVNNYFRTKKEAEEYAKKDYTEDPYCISVQDEDEIDMIEFELNGGIDYFWKMNTR